MPATLWSLIALTRSSTSFGKREDLPHKDATSLQRQHRVGPQLLQHRHEAAGDGRRAHLDGELAPHLRRQLRGVAVPADTWARHRDTRHRDTRHSDTRHSDTRHSDTRHSDTSQRHT